MHQTVGPYDVKAAAMSCRGFLSDLVNLDWSTQAGGLEWSCRQTLEHIPFTNLFYSSQLALTSDERLPRARGGEDQLTVTELVLSVEVNAAILEHVIRAAPQSARSFHPAGMADRSGFAAMGCDEILIHTADIANGFEIDFKPPDGLCGRVLARLFPWVTADVGHWETLLWANGRVPLAGLGPQDTNWIWHCAPLAEWDGRIPRRT